MHARDSWRRAGRSLALLVLLAAGCRSGGSTLQTTPQQDGVYDFVARTGRYDLRGSLALASGVATIDSEIGYCRSDEISTSTQSFRFLCEVGGNELRNVVYIIDRRNPLGRSRWRANAIVTRQRRVCTRYAVQNGNRVCVEYQQEAYEALVPVGGDLTFTRRSS